MMMAGSTMRKQILNYCYMKEEHNNKKKKKKQKKEKNISKETEERKP